MKRRTHATPPRAGDGSETSSRSTFLDAGRAWHWGGAALLALSVWLTYRGSLEAPFIFDDVPTIVGNLSLRHLWPLVSFSGEMSPLQAMPQTAVYGRPLVNLSLALNYHFCQLDPRGYRGTNIVLHALAAIVLAAVVRRTLRLDFFQGRFAGVAEPLSLAAALVWGLHPLDIESVAYVTQRTELMMGLCYLLTLYASQRYWSATSSITRALWLALATVACQLGMLSKETIASAPAMVLLYERTFVTGSFKDALRNSWLLYIGLLSSWFTLLALNIHGPSTPAVGFGLGIPALTWWFTQCKVLFLYLKLVIWPWPLVIHYEIPRLNSFVEAWPWFIPAALLVVAIAVLVVRRTTLGFVGTWVFAVLSPTLLVPLIIEVAAERRMYVPLMAIVPFVVVGCYALLARGMPPVPQHGQAGGMPKPLRFTLVAAIVLAGSYSALDLRRLAVFGDSLSFWADAESNQPDSPLVQLSLGGALADAGRDDEAIAHYQRAVELNPALFTGQYRLAEALQAIGRMDEAEQALEKAIRSNPEMAAGHYGLAQLLYRRGEKERAKEEYLAALERLPDFPKAHYALAVLLDEAGESAQARQHYESAIELQANYPAARRALGLLLLRSGDPIEAIEQFRRMPPSADACANLAIAYSRANRPTEALAMAQAGAAMARSQGQAAEAARLDAWAKEYRESRGTLPHQAPRPLKLRLTTVDRRAAVKAPPAWCRRWLGRR